MRGKSSRILAEVASGALAGGVATVVMGRVTTYLYEREAPVARAREDAARAGQTAYGVAAEKLARLVSARPSPARLARLGGAIHWGLGVGAGALYGVLRPRLPAATRAGGLAFGAAFWLVMDETMVPVLRLTPGPAAFPWQTHARGLAGHLTFGAVADAVLRLLDAGARRLAAR